MRIFVGIKLDDAIRESITRELNSFKKIANSIRWTEIGNIHLTLKFIGEVAEVQVEQIKEVLLAAKIPVAPFLLKISGFGKYPAGDDLHIFWAGVEDNPYLQILFDDIENTLGPLGIAREVRPFNPHITLGRNKAHYNFKTLFELLAEKRAIFLAECRVTSFQLFSSHLTPAGPQYKILKEIPLEQS
ncbi:MAG: RNA 2',3'-cyclic phosphodiesterase [Chrysiogenales bacterium]